MHQRTVAQPAALAPGEFQLHLVHVQFVQNDFDHFDDRDEIIMAEIEDRFSFFFKKLNVVGTDKLVAKLVTKN